jgi:thioredoxin-related protein
VDRLEKDLAGRAEVIRIDVMTELGITIARRYGVRATPMLLVFDGAGRVVYSQAGRPNTERITEAVSQAAGS